MVEGQGILAVLIFPAVVGGRGRSWLRSGLVVTQVSLSFILLVGAVLLMKSVHEIRGTSPGFSRGTLTGVVDPFVSGYDVPRAKAFHPARPNGARQETDTNERQSNEREGQRVHGTHPIQETGKCASRSSCPASSAGKALRFAWKSTAEEE